MNNDTLDEKVQTAIDTALQVFENSLVGVTKEQYAEALRDLIEEAISMREAAEQRRTS